MKSSGLIVAILLAFLSDCHAAKPSILVKVKFSISWREMCQVEKYLKENVAKQIAIKGKMGSTLSSDRIVLYDWASHCNPPSKTGLATVEMFVVEETNMSNIDVSTTQKLYNVLYYLHEHKQERYIGKLFVGKITAVTVEGKDAPSKKEGYTEIERLYIGIGVACAILVLIVIVLFAISCFKNKNKPKEDRYSARAAYRKDNQEVRTFPMAADNPTYEHDRGAGSGQTTQTDHRLTTQF